MGAFESRRVTALAIIAVTTTGWLLRLAGIDQRTLFWDEAYHLKLVLEPSVGQMLDAVLRNPPSDPLYALLLRAWSGVFGVADPIARLPSTVFGALAIPAAAWLGWEITASRRVAVMSAVMVALGPYLIEFAQEASLYALATLLTTLALAAGLRWLRTGVRADAALAVGLAILATYSHYVVPVFLAGSALLSLTRFGPPRSVPTRKVLLAVAVVGIAWVPWAAPMIASWASDPNSRTAVVNAASVTELGGALSQYASGTGALLERIRPVQLLGVGAAAVLLVRGWLVAGEGRPRTVRVILMVAAVLFVAPWLVSQLTGRWLFVAHMMLVALPSLAVAAAAGAVMPVPVSARSLGGLLARPQLGGLALSGLIVAQVAGIGINAVSPPHGDDGTRQMVETITALAQPGDLLVTSPAEYQIVFERYLELPVHGLPRDLDVRGLYPPYDAAQWQHERTTRFAQLTSDSDRAWLVYAPDRDDGGAFLSWLGTNSRLTLQRREQIGDLYLIELP